MNSKNRTLLIIVGVIVAVLGLAGIAVLAGGGGDSSSGVVDPSETTTAPPSSGDVEQNRPIAVEGDNVPSLTDVDPDPALGTAFPTINGQSFDGTPISIGGASDGPTMVVYLAHWCPHCNDEIPELIELNNRDGVPADMRVVGVSTAVDNTAPNYPPSEWLVEKGWPWEAMADDADSSAFMFSGGSGFPYLVILDADGNVLARDSGEKSAEDLAVWIQDALANAPTA
ncbi:MAG TPA: TlpA disulfide reductase family protein [Ilumatobacteraceae bacterium]|nr:TlpA disulfide reductase family protein [Ilumatobacteraceae bacterium]